MRRNAEVGDHRHDVHERAAVRRCLARSERGHQEERHVDVDVAGGFGLILPRGGGRAERCLLISSRCGSLAWSLGLVIQDAAGKEYGVDVHRAAWEAHEVGDVMTAVKVS